jgi:hypothetical protein
MSGITFGASSPELVEEPPVVEPPVVPEHEEPPADDEPPQPARSSASAATSVPSVKRDLNPAFVPLLTERGIGMTMTLDEPTIHASPKE